MPAHPFKTDFTGGELTERLDGRVDFRKYASGARCIRNMVPVAHGGVMRRAGTTYVAKVKDSGAFEAEAFDADAFDAASGQTGVRLVPFEFSTEQTYIVEMGTGYMRFFADRAPVLDGSGLPVEVTTPYDGPILRELRMAQSADVKYFAHQQYAPHKLSRVTASSFTFAPITFLPPGTSVIPLVFDATLTLSALTGLGVTATASNPIFLAGDSSRNITYAGGRAIIKTVNSATQVTVDVIDAFSTLVLPANTWELDGTPNVSVAPDVVGAPHGTTRVYTAASVSAFRVTDVGKYIVMFEGVGKIYQYLAADQVNVEILLPFTKWASPAFAVPGGWTLESDAWSATRGYPGVVHLFGQRTWWAGSLAEPDTVWASVIGDYENLARSGLDDDGIKFVIANNQVNLVRWMKSLRHLMLGTIGGEYHIHGGTDKPITPDNIQVDDEAAWGSDYTVDAERVGQALMFLQRGARNLRELAFSFEADGFLAPSLSILAEHLTREHPIVEMAFLPQPDPTLFAVRDDGALLTLTYERPEQVVAWAHHLTDGRFLSVAVKPNHCGSGHEVWVAVERTIYDADAAFSKTAFDSGAFDIGGGTPQTVRTIEVFDGWLNTDSALAYDGIPEQEFADLSHLEGKRVAVVYQDGPFDLDAFEAGTFQEYQLGFEYTTVEDGIVTITTPRSTVEIGLPYDCEVQLLRPELALPNGSLQGRRQRYNELTLRLYCTSGRPTITGRAGDVVEAVRLPEGVDTPYTGDVRQTQFGWDREGRPRIKQTDPLPFTLLSVGGSIQADDG